MLQRLFCDRAFGKWLIQGLEQGESLGENDSSEGSCGLVQLANRLL
jgi:hypothetical protein